MPTRPGPYATCCRLNTTTAVVAVEREWLRPCLSIYPGVELLPTLGLGADEHPLWFEFAYVHEGQPVAWGPASRWPGMFGAWARGFAGITARVLGTYFEVMFCVPNVRLAGQLKGPLNLVLGMYTDSPIPKWGDELLRCGYHKRLTRILRTSSGEVSVYDERGRRLLASRAKPPGGAVDAAVCIRNFTLVERWWNQPLLGYLGGSEYALTELARSRDRQTVDLPAPESFQVEVGVGACVPSGIYAPPSTSRGGLGVYCAERVHARLSYPTHFKLE